MPVQAPQAPTAYVRLAPHLHALAYRALGPTLLKPLAEIRRHYENGSEIVCVCPDARTVSGRRKIAKVLRAVGLEPEIVRVLGWATIIPESESPEAPPEEAPSSLLAAEQVPAPSDAPTITDEPEAD